MNILLCLNKLGIGGIETAVLNQTIQYNELGHKVIILAEDGIYRKKFEDAGAQIIDFKYEISNRYDYKKIEFVENILEENKIEQVHIHQIDCINTVFPACMKKNIPYVAYLHNGIKRSF